MNFLKEINEDAFLLIPYNIKDKILDYIDENRLLLNIKIITFNDLKKGLLFDYNEETIYNLMKHENISYNQAINYINNMYYIVEDKYKEDKLNNLLRMKTYLSDNKLLIKDDLFIDLLKSKKKIYVYGFDYISKFNNYLLDLASKYIKIDKKNKTIGDYNHKVYEAKSMEDEVIFVAENISKLIKEGISLNKIYLTGINDDYEFTIKRIFNAYNIPYFIKKDNRLYDTAIIKYFFNNLDEDVDKLLKKIEKKYDVNNNDANMAIYNKLVKLINKYSYWKSSYKDVKDIMIEDAKSIKLSQVHMEQEVVKVDIYDNIFNDDEYVFLMNFNQGIFPKIKKDEDYITDDIKPEFIEKTNEINELNKNALINNIKSIKNLTITYKLNSLFDTYLPTYLIEDYFDKPIKIEDSISNYSDSINEFLYAKKIDYLTKFRENDPLLPILKNNYKIPYDTYDNSFTGIKDKIIPSSYSYSSMSNYFKCPFRYYCNNVMYIEEFTKTLDTFIGSLFHEVLELHFKEGKDIDEIYDNFLKKNEELEDTDKNKYECNNKDNFFIDKLRDEIHVVVDLIKKQYENLDPSHHEDWEYPIEKYSQDMGLNTETNAKIKGFVDKIIHIGNDVFIIDYKTGSSDQIKRNTFEYGLHLQLPIYMYLVEKINPELNVAGVYLQYILKGDNKKDPKKSKLELKENEVRLDGLFIDDESVMDQFTQIDKSYFINTKTRMYTYDEKNEMKDMVEQLITDCINKTYNAEFDIKPININDGAEDGCKYCHFRDVCYMKEEQYNHIYKKGVKGDEENE